MISTNDKKCSERGQSLLMLLACCESNVRRARAGERLSCNNKHYCYGINPDWGVYAVFTRWWLGGSFTGWGNDNLIIIRTIRFQYLWQNINIGFQ